MNFNPFLHKPEISLNGAKFMLSLYITDEHREFRHEISKNFIFPIKKCR